MKRAITKNHIDGMTSLIGATFLYATVGFLSKFIGYSLPLFYQSWTKYLLAALLVVGSYKSWKPINKPAWRWIVLRMLAGSTSFILFFVSVNVLPVSLSYFIFYGGMTVAGFALGAIMFGEKTTTLRWISLGLALLGLLLVYGVGVSLHGPLFVLLAFLSGVSSSFWGISTKKITEYPAVQLTFLDNALAVPLFIAISAIVREPWPITDFSLAQGASLLTGVIFIATALLVIRGFRHLDAQLGSLVMLSEIVFVLLFDAILFQTTPSLPATLGGILIITAMVLPELNWSALAERLYAHRRKTHR
jgi:drug/metabolite transporter (DMT)-like permease